MRIILSLVLIFFCKFGYCQKIPSVGTDALTEIGAWNLEWFGKSTFGPTDESLQKNNIQKVIQSLDLDIWGFCEVVNKDSFARLMATIPQYNYVIAPISSEQKTALAFKSESFSLISSKAILPAFKFDFANGRLPFEVILKAKGFSEIDTLICIVIHLKANFGVDTAKAASYAERQKASMHLKHYCDSVHKGHNLIVIGDWNDDLDVSIFNNLETPFVNFINDSTTYFFPTQALTNAGFHSTTGFSDMIDQQMVNNNMKQKYVMNSANVYDLTSYITKYSATTSDHFPVYGLYNFKPYSTQLDQIIIYNQLEIYPNPASNNVNIFAEEDIDIIDNCGKSLYSGMAGIINVSNWDNGIYFVRVRNNKMFKILIVQNINGK